MENIELLENQFREAVNKCHKELNDQFNKIDEEIKKAAEIAEKYGIPFRLQSEMIDPYEERITYTPKSFEKWNEMFDLLRNKHMTKFKYGDLVEEDSKYAELMDLINIYSSTYGWNHSRIC